MTAIGTFVTQDGIEFQIVYGEPFPCDEKIRPERTIFLAPEPCYVCGNPVPRSCEIFLSQQTALLVSQHQRPLPEVVVAFRSGASGFPLSGTYRLVLGRLTSEVLQAITLLYLPQRVFEVNAYPAPYEGEWKRLVVSYCDAVVRSVIDSAYTALADEPRSTAGLSQLHEIVLGVIRFIPQSILLRDFM